MEDFQRRTLCCLGGELRQRAGVRVPSPGGRQLSYTEGPELSSGQVAAPGWPATWFFSGLRSSRIPAGRSRLGPTNWALQVAEAGQRANPSLNGSSVHLVCFLAHMHIQNVV